MNENWTDQRAKEHLVPETLNFVHDLSIFGYFFHLRSVRQKRHWNSDLSFLIFDSFLNHLKVDKFIRTFKIEPVSNFILLKLLSKQGILWKSQTLKFFFCTLSGVKLWLDWLRHKICFENCIVCIYFSIKIS